MFAYWLPPCWFAANLTDVWSVAYAMNRMFPEPEGDLRGADIVTAAYTALATSGASVPVVG